DGDSPNRDVERLMSTPSSRPPRLPAPCPPQPRTFLILAPLITIASWRGMSLSQFPVLEIQDSPPYFRASASPDRMCPSGSDLVRWLSGRKQRFAKAPYPKKVPRVRIPPSPLT